MTTSTRIATDVGGTFTDLVAIQSDADGLKITTAKSDTTPPDYEKGVLNVMAKGGIDSSEVGFLVHGTTVVINCLLYTSPSPRDRRKSRMPSSA